MSPEATLRRPDQFFVPRPGAQERIKRRVLLKIGHPQALTDAGRALNPGLAVPERIWQRVLSSIVPVSTVSFLDRVRDFLTPSEELTTALRTALLARLRPVPAPAMHRLQWVAAFTVLLFLVRLTPFIFLPPSIAASPFTILPQGHVYVLSGGLWQPVTDELLLEHSALIQTQEGSATIIAHDDYFLRLAAHTTIAVHDLTDRPSHSSHSPTLTLHEGKVWILGLVPPSFEGVTVVAPQSTVTLHQASVSLSTNGRTDTEVSVWDRRAEIAHAGVGRVLFAGERLTLQDSALPKIEHIAERAYDDPWVSGNMVKDAVHQREIAHLQQERRAALAGILPGSPLYMAKRAAEVVDRTLTLGAQARAAKAVAQADTRLNEAAALLSAGNVTEATVSLQEYRDTLVAVASGSGGDSLVQSIVQHELTVASADTSAALPSDTNYVLKRVVLETQSAVSESTVKPEDLQLSVVVDTLSAIKRQVAEGKDLVGAKKMLIALEPTLSSLVQADALTDPVKQEVRASVTAIAHALDASGISEGKDLGILETVTTLSPPHSTLTAAVHHLTDDEIESLVRRIHQRIFLYHEKRARWNQLLVEFQKIDGLPDQGKILRVLYHALPENGLARYVRTEWARVRQVVERREAEALVHQGGTQTTAAASQSSVGAN